MKWYELPFLGYTWDEYFYVISEKRGVLITYQGALDSEGVVRMDEILLVEGAKCLRDIYESDRIQEIRKEICGLGSKLFFSYAETNDNYSEIAAYLNELIRPRYLYNNNKGMVKMAPVLCKGACALFPDKIISEE